MSEPVTYTYEGNVKLDLSRFVHPKKEVRIEKIVHLIPVQIHAYEGDNPVVVTGYMDYSTNTAEIPPSSLKAFEDPTAFMEAVRNHIQKRILPNDLPPSRGPSPEVMESIQKEINKHKKIDINQYTKNIDTNLGE